MEFAAAGDIQAALSALAATVDTDIGHAEALRDTTAQVHARISAAWAGSLRDEAMTGIAHATTAVDKLNGGISGLHRCAELLRSAAGHY